VNNINDHNFKKKFHEQVKLYSLFQRRKKYNIRKILNFYQNISYSLLSMLPYYYPTKLKLKFVANAKEIAQLLENKINLSKAERISQRIGKYQGQL